MFLIFSVIFSALLFKNNLLYILKMFNTLYFKIRLYKNSDRIVVGNKNEKIILNFFITFINNLTFPLLFLKKLYTVSINCLNGVLSFFHLQRTNPNFFSHTSKIIFCSSNKDMRKIKKFLIIFMNKDYTQS